MNPKRLDTKDITKFLAADNAVHINSHFVGTSGQHLDAYVDKDTVGKNPHTLEAFAFELAHRLIEEMEFLAYNTARIVGVVGAPMGAISFSNRVTFWLNEILHRPQGYHIQALYAEKTGFTDESPFRIRPAFANVMKNGGHVILIEDILNTGGSAEKTMKAIWDAEGCTVAVGAICNRGGVTAEQLKVPSVNSLLDVKFNKYNPEKCPMCNDRIPMRTDLGHGLKFVDKWNADHPDDLYPTA